MLAAVEGQDAADERVRAVAVGVDDHHVARPAELEGAQDREVVAAAGATVTAVPASGAGR